MWRSIQRAAAWILQEPPTPRVVLSSPPTGAGHVLLHISFGDRPRKADGGGLWLHQVTRPEDTDDVVTLIRNRELPVDGVVVWGVDTIPCGVELRARWLSRLAHRLAPITLWLPASRGLRHPLRRLGCQVIVEGGPHGDFSAREHRQ